MKYQVIVMDKSTKDIITVRQMDIDSSAGVIGRWIKSIDLKENEEMLWSLVQ